MCKIALIFYDSPNLSIKNLNDYKFAKKEAATILGLIEFISDFNNLHGDFLLRKVWLEKYNYLEYILACIGIDKLDSQTASEFITHHINILKPKFPSVVTI